MATKKYDSFDPSDGAAWSDVEYKNKLKKNPTIPKIVIQKKNDYKKTHYGTRREN